MEDIKQIDICDELSQNFLDYAIECNQQRAFPDVRDGLKPGQRACLYTFYNSGFLSNKPHVKCAKVSGQVIATLWPHGDAAIYETFARMSQTWINNVPEVDWHGANGSQIMGSAPASARYTEARLSKVTEDGMFQGIKKNAVDMIPNFSEDMEWPAVLPAVLPRLLLNGSQGLGLTIANYWAPMCFDEVCKILVEFINTGKLDYSIMAPSFPSGGIIVNKDDMHTIYETGKGKIILRGKAEIKKKSIFITEMPYQIYVEPYIDSVKDLVIKGDLTGIDNIFNRSDNKGIKIEIVCDENPENVLKQLYTKTDLQKIYHPNQWALEGTQTRIFTMRDYCETWMKHNLICIKREHQFDLDKATARKHIVDGLLICLEDLDNVIALIKKSESAKAAKVELMNKYNLDDEQAAAILAMRLSSLAHLEKLELENENKELITKIADLNTIINSNNKLKEILVTRLIDLNKKYPNPRRTALKQIDISEPKEEIVPENVVAVLTRDGLIKRVPLEDFKKQGRYGKGIKSVGEVICAVSTNTINNIYLFSSLGRMYRLAVNDIPAGTLKTKGTAISGLIKLNDNETIVTMNNLDTAQGDYIVFFTKKGYIKKSLLSEYLSLKRSAVIAIKLTEGDQIINVKVMRDQPAMIVTKCGQAILFETKNISTIGRTTVGVKGITLDSNDEVISGLCIKDFDDSLFIIDAEGKGKRITFNNFSVQGRGGKGVSISNDNIVVALDIKDTNNVIISGNPNSIYIEATSIALQSKDAQGVSLIKDTTNIISASILTN